MSPSPSDPEKSHIKEALSLSGPAQRAHMADCMEAVAESQSRPAFDTLFAYFAPRLRTYLMRLGATAGEAEELTQDVMATVWRKAASFDRRRASVSTWMFRVARNRQIDVHRRQQKPDLDAEEPLLQPSAPQAPDEMVHRMQLDETVRRALEVLPEAQLMLLQAAFYRGMSHAEIASAFDLPLGTVKSRIRLAFNRLRGELADAEEGE